MGLLTGCQSCWTKAGGTGEEFEREGRECLKESSPTPEAARSGIGSEKIYKACLQKRGWGRENTTVGEGKFRGVEDRD